MIGLDTNLLVRFYASDDAAQTLVAARTLQGADTFFVPKSVVLELYWVLASVHATPRQRILEVLRHLLGLEHVQIEDEDSVRAAVDHFESGLEFEDAMHLAACRDCDRMLTFDRKLAQRAGRLALAPRCEVPK